MNLLLRSFTNDIFYDLANSICANYILELLSLSLSNTCGNFIQFNVRVIKNLFKSLNWIVAYVQRNISGHAFEIFVRYSLRVSINSNGNGISENIFDRRRHTFFEFIPIIEYAFKVLNAGNLQILKIFNVFHLFNSFIDVLFVCQS